MLFVAEPNWRVSLCRSCKTWLWSSHRTAGCLLLGGSDTWVLCSSCLRKNLLAVCRSRYGEESKCTLFHYFDKWMSGMAFLASNRSLCVLGKFSISLHRCSWVRVASFRWVDGLLNLDTPTRLSFIITFVYAESNIQFSSNAFLFLDLSTMGGGVRIAHLPPAGKSAQKWALHRIGNMKIFFLLIFKEIQKRCLWKE